MSPKKFKKSLFSKKVRGEWTPIDVYTIILHYLKEK